MASASAIKAGETFVTMSLEAGDMEKGIKSMTRKLNNFASSAVKVGAVLTGIGGIGVAGLTKAAAAANRVELVGRRLDAVFREAADEARNFARALAVDIGDSRFAVEDTMVTFKSFFAEIINSEDDQKKFSRRMTELSRDFAAFQGMDTTEALQRFISALSGSPEVLDRFGINLKAAALDAEFAAKGLDETTESAAEFEKVIARMDIIERTLSKQGAIGKAQKELKTFSGALRAATSAVRDFSVAVGQALLPILRPAIALFANLARGFEVLATHAPVLTVAFGVMVVSTAALGVTILAAAAAATALALALTVATTIATTYSGYVKKMKLETAGFAGVLAHATNQFRGFTLGAGAAGVQAMGFGVSAKQAAAGLNVLRSSALGVLGVLGKLGLITVIASSALGAVPGSGAAIAVSLGVAAAASVIFSATLKRAGHAAEFASYRLALYTSGVNASATASQRASIWTAAFASKMGLAGKSIAVFAVGLKVLKFAAMGVAFALSPVGLIVAGLAALVGGLAIGLSQVAREMGRFGDASAVAAVKTQNSTTMMGRAWKAYKKDVAGTFETISDGWANMWGNATAAQKRAAQAATEAKQARKDMADEMAGLDEKIQDALIQGIKDTSDRERAELRARHARNIKEEAKKDDAILALSARHFEEMDALRNGSTPATAGAIRAMEIRHEREYDLALDNSERIAKTREAHMIEEQNLAAKHAERRFNLEREYAGRLARARINARHEGAALEMAMMKERHAREWQAALSAGRDMIELDKIQAQERANAVMDFRKSVQEQTATLDQELEAARIAAIEDEEQRELEAIDSEFKARMKALKDEEKAEKALREQSGESSASLDGEFFRQGLQLEELREKAIEAIRKKHRESRDQEDEAAANQRRSEIQSMEDTINKMEIDLGGGTELEKTLAKLDVDRAQALRDAGGDLEKILQVSKLFGLKKLAAKQAEGAKAAELSGGFGKRQLAGLAPKASMSRQEKLAQEGNEKLALQIKIAQDIANMLKGAPFIGGLVP